VEWALPASLPVPWCAVRTTPGKCTNTKRERFRLRRNGTFLIFIREKGRYEVSNQKGNFDESRDGFISFNDGGWQHFLYAGNDLFENFRSLPDDVKKRVEDKRLADELACMSVFLTDGKWDYGEAFVVADEEELQKVFDSMSDEDFDRYHETENEFYREEELCLKCSAIYYQDGVPWERKTPGQGKLHVSVALNFDQPYFRSNGNYQASTGRRETVEYTLFEKTLDFDEVNAGKLLKLEAEISAALHEEEPRSRLSPA
jgi:hypothetical protein